MYSDDQIEKCYNYYSPYAQAQMAGTIPGPLEALKLKFPQGEVIDGVFWAEGKPKK